MAVVLLTVVLFAGAVLMLSVGVLLRKRTPLRGSCHAPLGPDSGAGCAEGSACHRCVCGRVAGAGPPSAQP